MSDADLQTQRSIEHYAASVQAWYATALEHDKSILTLAGGGIAILITLLTTVGIDSWITFALLSSAMVSLLVSLGAVLEVFRLNKDYIAFLVREEPGPTAALKRWDKIARWAFIAGVAFASALGVTSALTSLLSKQEQQERAAMRLQDETALRLRPSTQIAPSVLPTASETTKSERQSPPR